MSDRVIYTVGGTVQAGGGIYIHRDADEELLRLCQAGEFCYVLTARQMGKSSLMVATRERLAAENIRSVEIDLTQMGSKLSGLTAERWYLGLMDLIVNQLDLDIDYMAWWDERARLGPTQRLSQFLRQVVLERVSEPVVIFIDEIDSTLNLDFTDDFFAAIRACYNARASDPAFKRLSFVLLGVATPGDLISDPQRTPFNIGRWMNLTDFTERQAIPLANGLGLPPVEAGQVLTWILDWTGGHPYLTQRLCAAAAASPESWNVATVDKLVEEIFFGEQSAQDSNLRFVRDMLTQRAPDKSAVLKTYRRIRAGKAVPDEERSPVKTHLKLSGVVKKAEDGTLHIRNKIYHHVFDLTWVRENTAISWAPIVAGIAVFVALLAVGFILYNAWVGIQFQDCVANFYQTNAPEERVAHLAKIFRLQGLLGPTDYDYQARELFYGLSRKEQLALFNVNNTEESDLIVLIKGLYITLADTDGTDSTRPLLEAMVQALDYLDETEETSSLRNEINSWLEGRKLAKQNLYAGALAEYDKAIALNGGNPATLYERARVLIELSEYQQALRGLDQVMAIARRAPAPTPTLSPTLVVSSTLTPEPTTSPTLTPTSTSTPGTDITPTETSPSASVTATSVSLPTPTATPTPAAIISEFATTGQMISAVRNIIDGNPDLVSSLVSASSSEYPNLREFGLVPTPSPVRFFIPAVVPLTATLTFVPSPTSTQVSIVMAPLPTPTQMPTSTLVTPPPKPLGDVEVWDVDINPRNSKVIYAVVKGQGIYKSTDGGYRWEAAQRAFETVESLAIAPTDPSILYVSIWDGILKSTDSGTTWELIAVGKDALPEPAHVLAVVPGNHQIIYAGTEGGVYRSSNGGQKWEARNNYMADTPIYALAIGSRDGELVYAAGKGAEIWKSIDGGSSPWEKLSSGHFKEAIYALALHPDNSQWIYAGSNESTVVLSTNGGRDWQLRNWGLAYRPLSLKISSLAIDPKDPSVIYAGTGFRSNLNGYGVYKSTDGGLSWESINNGLPMDATWLGGYYVQSIAIDPHDSQTIYAAGFGGLYKSTDGGQLWKRQ